MPFLPAQPSAPALHIEGGVATITLNRPAQRNRLENGDLKTLLAQFEQINQNAEVRVVVLEGEGKHFTSGIDWATAGMATAEAAAPALATFRN